MNELQKHYQQTGLYDPQFEHDACGVGFVANIDGSENHLIIQDGISIINNLAHRGAIGGDLKTGDGAGILSGIPHRFFKKESVKLGFHLPEKGNYGVGSVFLPLEKETRTAALSLIETVIKREGGNFIGWRDVPVLPGCLGKMALDSMPFVSQAFCEFTSCSGDNLERKLYIVRRCIETEARKWGLDNSKLYVSSLSSRTIIYKGMFLAYQLSAFYPDLSNRDFHSCLALVHQRYSTNTLPAWHLAQPFRLLAHNGEINTLRGNINKMRARGSTLSSDLFGDDISKLLPVVDGEMSDSANIDMALELLFRGGRSLEHSLMMMVPEAFGSIYHISQDKRAFYEYHASIMEPWDGPAALAFTDGQKIGALLDRNGLRPARYAVTKSGKIVMASEAGVLDIPPEDILQKGRLAPGKMIVADTVKKRIIYDNEIKSTVSRSKPYRRWLEKNRIELKGLFQVPGPVSIEHGSLAIKQEAFGYTREDIEMILAPMGENAQEPISSMGNDSALAVLSESPQLLYSYFKQLFAQVTNPPIDAYRENLVMSNMSFIGRERNLLEESPEHCHQLRLPYPILTNDDVEKLRSVDIEGFKGTVLSICIPTMSGDSIHKAITGLCHRAEMMVNDGYSLLVLSDRDMDATHIPVPALLATAAVHHHLVRVGKRQLTGLIVETGEAREVTHMALLIGYGASAVNPYLAFELLTHMNQKGDMSQNLKPEAATENYITAIRKGLLKIMSKMGVSTIRSYRGAQIFEAIGLHKDVVDKYFTGTASRIGGIDLNTIFEEAKMRHQVAFAKKPQTTSNLPSGGVIHYRNNSEKHILSPEVIFLAQRAMRHNDYDLYKQYAQHANDSAQRLCTLRGLFKFKKSIPIPLEEVEPEQNIIKRFYSGAMSLGSISKEAHETIAIAMNRLGASSNSGEGGEDEARFKVRANGDNAISKVKQVASARFGVTSNYLIHADELQIKIAQGAKPGEGGQLPGHKVDEYIAKIRHSTPGVMLISPPPHHDIYSIEDLAQLIFDLKNANPSARISVKLVSEVGVGTVAAGVAKGKADMVLISGHDGGTGASPLSSIKHAGMPWEIGLADTQQTLVMNELRDKIRVQTDGKMKTGRDVVIGALLGAEEFGFGTMAVISMGCIMMRKCHLNTCPVGVATQDARLRERFTGKPENLVNFMRFIARDIREIMASLGFRTFDEMVGRVDMLEVNGAISHWKTKGLDFSRLLAQPRAPEGAALRCVSSPQHDWSFSLDPKLIKKAKPALENKQPVEISMKIRNCNRTVGTTLSSEVSKRYGSKGLKARTIHCKFTGSAGQSFGAFLAPGIHFELEGDSNDYFGKGLSGGIISIYPPKKSTFQARNNIITGNVNLFGATSGEVYINGMAGERFAVRNSGAIAVVEGVGDHGCEYMTGGLVVVLGETGVNFAAGMSGGIAYVLDENQLFDTKCNLEMVDIEPLADDDEALRLLKLIKQHVKYTDSRYGEQIIKNWQEMRVRFVKVIPIDYRRALERMQKQNTGEAEVVTLTEEVFR